MLNRWNFLKTGFYEGIIFSFFSKQEQEELLGASQGSPVFDNAPFVIQKLLVFPYAEGMAFVSALLNVGQLDAIDEAFDNPPVSTEQILHPEKYFENEMPSAVLLPDLLTALGAGWSEIDSDVMGEFFIRTYLETTASEGAAALAAAGWGGDRYVLVQGPQEERVFVAVIAWDTKQDAREFFDIAPTDLNGSANQRYLGIQEDRTLLVVATTESLIEVVRDHFPGF